MQFKWSISFIFCLSIALFFVSSCDTGMDDDTSGEVEVGTFNFTIDGVSYDAIGTARIVADTSFIWSVESIILAAGDPLNGILSFGITLFLPENQQPANASYSYCIEGQAGAEICGIMNWFGNSDGGTSAEDGGAMMVNFSEIDYQLGGVCKGTFSGTLINEGQMTTSIITDGEFNLVFQ